MRPLVIWMVESLPKRHARLFFSTGKIVEVKLPALPKGFRGPVRIVHRGLGLDLGGGYDVGADQAYKWPGKVWRRGQRLEHATGT
jgi:hypothetical protein